MPNLSYPGVYIQEISSGVRPIAAASTSTAAFVGLAEMGPDDATLVTSWTDFQRAYGSFIADSFLAHSVFQFFNNGGRQCYIVRVTRADAARAAVTLNNRANPAVAGVTFTAKNKGAWGNSLVLQIQDGSNDPNNEFKISVRRQAQADTIPDGFLDTAPLEVLDNLSVDPNAANYVVSMLTQNSNLIDAAILNANSIMQRGFHRGGVTPALPLNANLSFQINLDYDGWQVVTLPNALNASTVLADIAAAIQTAVIALGATKKKTSTPAAAFASFTCTVETVAGVSRLLLQSGSNTGAGTENARSSVQVQGVPANNAAPQLRLGAGNGGRSEDALAPRRPANADIIQLGDASVLAPVTAVVVGTDGDPSTPLTETAFSGVFTRLDTKTDFSLLAVPGESTPVMMDLGVAYCSNRPLQDVFYVGETDKTDDTMAEALAFRGKLTKANSYGALYFPWVKTLDPTGRSRQPILLPPSGYVAGLFARIDATRGVWKAPAGTEASLNGVVGLVGELSDQQQGNLNPLGVNVIRRFPASGIVVFGARTITSDPEWTYVPVRRMAIMLRVSIYNGIQWAVFEPNDEPLWSQLRLNIGSFMTTLFRQGAFQGSTPTQAFFVKCDGETTTQADIDLGIVNILVGFAPLKPAEFVVVKLSQKAGQSS
jgi:uncharacterized protein